MLQQRSRCCNDDKDGVPSADTTATDCSRFFFTCCQVYYHICSTLVYILLYTSYCTGSAQQQTDGDTARKLFAVTVKVPQMTATAVELLFVVVAVIVDLACYHTTCGANDARPTLPECVTASKRVWIFELFRFSCQLQDAVKNVHVVFLVLHYVRAWCHTAFIIAAPALYNQQYSSQQEYG